MNDCNFCGARRWLEDDTCGNCGAPKDGVEPDGMNLALDFYKAPMSIAVRLGRLERGDYVIHGLYGGEWQKGSRTVERVDLAEATGYRVVTFTDRTRTSGHESMFVHIKR